MSCVTGNDSLSDDNKFEEVAILLDDGHKPGQTEVPTKVICYKNKNSNKFASFYDNVLSEMWRKRIYDYAVERGRPWGVYITTAMVNDSTLDIELMWKETPQLAMALEACRKLMFGKADGLIGADRENIHGTVVWCLTSTLSNTVEYHIDYAELYRYETNVVYPPIYGGVYHASPFAINEMNGGDFMLNMEGLDHYRRFGYKGALQSYEALEKDMKDGDWCTIKYKANRGMVFDGDLPHLATPVTRLPKKVMNNELSAKEENGIETESTDAPHTTAPAGNDTVPVYMGKYGSTVPSFGGDCMSRVILGFNCFPAGPVGDCAARAPEHSDAFCRTVKLYQAMAAMGMPVTAVSGDQTVSHNETCCLESPCNSKTAANHTPPAPVVKKGGMSIKDVKKNPALCKLLVMAARKMKEKDAANSSRVTSSSTDKNDLKN